MASLQRAKACIPVSDPGSEAPYYKQLYGMGHLVRNLTLGLAFEDVVSDAVAAADGRSAEEIGEILDRGWGDQTGERDAILARYSGEGVTQFIDRCAKKLRLFESSQARKLEGSDHPSVILFDRPQLQRWLLDGGDRRCREWLFAPEISFHDTFVHLSFNKSLGEDFFNRFQQGLLWLHKHGSMATMSQILTREYLQGESCPAIEGLAKSEKISLESQLGLFLVFGVICALSVVAAMAEILLGRWRRRRQAQAQSQGQQDEEEELEDAGMTDGEMLRYLVRHSRELENRLDKALASPGSADAPSGDKAAGETAELRIPADPRAN